MEVLRLDELVDGKNFDEAAYLAANPDVAAAVAAGDFASGRQHYYYHGYREGRSLRFKRGLDELRADKMKKLLPLLQLDLPHLQRGLKFDSSPRHSGPRRASSTPTRFLQTLTTLQRQN